MVFASFGYSMVIPSVVVVFVASTNIKRMAMRMMLDFENYVSHA